MILVPLLCILSFIGGAVLILVLILKRAAKSSRLPEDQAQRRPQLGGRTPPRFNTRVVHDGFWLHGPSIRYGSVVRYRYRAGGQWRTGTCPIEPGPQGQFIYTGVQPTDIIVDEVVPPTTSGADFGSDEPAQQPSRPASEAPASEPPATTGESLTSYPSAY
jgi:hypothetical protein